MQITAVPNPGFALRYWLGDLSGGNLQQFVTIDDQHDVTAYFWCAPLLYFSVAKCRPVSSGNPQFDNTGYSSWTPGEIVTSSAPTWDRAGSPRRSSMPTAGSPARSPERAFSSMVWPSPMIYTSANQVSAVVPFAVTGKTTTVVSMEYNGAQSGGLQISAADSAPALFTINQSGRGQIAALNQDGISVNSPSNPAQPNSVVVLYATGGGPWTESIPDGQIMGSHLVAPKAPVFARVGKLPAPIHT